MTPREADKLKEGDRVVWGHQAWALDEYMPAVFNGWLHRDKGERRTAVLRVWTRADRADDDDCGSIAYASVGEIQWPNILDRLAEI